MRRSKVNEIVSKADELIRLYGFNLASFVYWSVDKFKVPRGDVQSFIDGRCGGDITNYGAGQFDIVGLSRFEWMPFWFRGRTRNVLRRKLLISRQD